jgi:hypothetical protein
VAPGHLVGVAGLRLVGAYYCLYPQYLMRFAVVAKYDRGRLLSDSEIEAKAALVGELTTYECPRESGGPEIWVLWKARLYRTWLHGIPAEMVKDAPGTHDAYARR